MHDCDKCTFTCIAVRNKIIIGYMLYLSIVAELIIEYNDADGTCPNHDYRLHVEQ